MLLSTLMIRLMYRMPRRSTSVRQLANEFGLDLDTCLVTLWDAGFEHIDDVDDRISAHELPRVHKSLGVATLREMKTLAYWEQRLGLKSDELRLKLAELGVPVTGGARILPKGALAKLKRETHLDVNVSVTGQSMSLGLAEDGDADRDTQPKEAPFRWYPVGAIRTCRYLSVEEVLAIHEALELEFATSPDPITPSGVRDQGLLESAVYRAQTSLGEDVKYPTAQMVAAAYLHSLIHNHPFHNGNKRTGLVTMLASLDRNNILLSCTEQEVFRYVLRVAQHRLISSAWSNLADQELIAIAEWINSNSRTLEKGDRPIKWRELRRNLVRLGCTLDAPQPGNRIKIHRAITEKRLFGRSRQRALIFTAGYAGEGREVPREYLHDIRQHLKFDDESGYDSGYFYGTDPREPDEFISQYRTILRRLAKL